MNHLRFAIALTIGFTVLVFAACGAENAVAPEAEQRSDIRQCRGFEQLMPNFEKIIADGKTANLKRLVELMGELGLPGSVVEVIDGKGFVEIKRHRCGLMEGAKSFARVGASLIAKEHCKTCVESHWQKVFSDLKLKMEVEHTEDGCIMRISTH